RAEHQVRIDEPGINRGAFHVPDARIRRWRDILAGGFDQSVADNDRAALDDLPGLDDNLAPDQSMDTQRQRTEARRKKFGSMGDSTKDSDLKNKKSRNSANRLERFAHLRTQLSQQPKV